MRVSNALGNSAAALAVSPSRVAIPLGGGCTLLVDPQLVLPAQTSLPGTAAQPMPVPDVVALLGVSVFFQWFVADPNGSWAGIGAWSEGLQAVIGN